MKTKHTPGEWKPVIHKSKYAPKEIITGVGVTEKEDNGKYKYIRVICDIIIPDTDEQYIKEHDEILANAKLIAAAPDLLAACLEVDELFKDTKAPTTEIITMLSRVNEAIEKATS